MSSAIYALHQGAIVGSFSLVSLFTGKILQKLGAIRCVIYGTGVVIIGSLLLVIFSIVMPNFPYSIILSMIVFVIGCAICQAVLFNASLNVFPEIKGTASSAVSFIRSFIMAVFIALTNCVYNVQEISTAILVLSVSVLTFIFTLYLLLLKDAV
ncbi:MAG: hypothetical protein ACR5LB_02090 [Wolbachia sp.]